MLYARSASDPKSLTVFRNHSPAGPAPPSFKPPCPWNGQISRLLREKDPDAGEEVKKEAPGAERNRKEEGRGG